MGDRFGASPYTTEERVWRGAPLLTPVCPCASTIAAVGAECARCETFACSLCGRWVTWETGHGNCPRCDDCCARAEGEGDCPALDDGGSDG